MKLSHWMCVNRYCTKLRLFVLFTCIFIFALLIGPYLSTLGNIDLVVASIGVPWNLKISLIINGFWYICALWGIVLSCITRKDGFVRIVG
jgi:uncharacterized membrane protein